MTYIDLINKVLRRLREDTVATYNQTDYSLLIGEFINETKREVEDSWRWGSLRTTITVSATDGTSAYTLTGSGDRFQLIDVWNNTNYIFMNQISQPEADLLINGASSGPPLNYTFYGASSGDQQVLITPIPDGSYSLIFTMYIPQDDLAADATAITVPWQPVMLGAYAKALDERGEESDGTLRIAEARYQKSLNDQIALDVLRNVDELVWYAN
jgi:hypothetical protein